MYSRIARLFNTLWLIANDVIFGSSSATFFMENAIPLAAWLESNLEVSLRGLGSSHYLKPNHSKLKTRGLHHRNTLWRLSRLHWNGQIRIQSD